MTLPKSLNDTLKLAIAQCAADGKLEEEGGVVMVKNKKFDFVKLANQNIGEKARVLWTACRYELSRKVLSRFKEIHGSFHTHPAFLARPSNLDLTYLFTGFPINYIYSTRDKELRRFTYMKEKSTPTKKYWKEDIIELTP